MLSRPAPSSLVHFPGASGPRAPPAALPSPVRNNFLAGRGFGIIAFFGEAKCTTSILACMAVAGSCFDDLIGEKFRGGRRRKSPERDMRLPIVPAGIDNPGVSAGLHVYALDDEVGGAPCSRGARGKD